MRQLLTLLAVLLPVAAHAQFNAQGFGFSKAQGVAYTGAMDQVTYLAFYALRAGSAAIAAAGTQKIVNLRRASDTHTCDVIVATSGNLGLTANCSTGGDDGMLWSVWQAVDATASCTVSGTTATCTGASAIPVVGDTITGDGISQPCRMTATTISGGTGTMTLSLAGTSTSCGTVGVAATLTMRVATTAATFYDQTANGNNAIQATPATQPQLLPDCGNSLPCLWYNFGPKLNVAVLSSTAAQPLTFTWVGTRIPSAASTQQQISTFSAGSMCGSAYSAANTLQLYCGGVGNATASDAVMHSVQMVANGASPNSTIYVDNVATNVSPGAGANSTALTLGNNVATANQPFLGFQMQVGIALSALNATQAGNTCHNDHQYWGTPIAC